MSQGKWLVVTSHFPFLAISNQFENLYVRFR